MIFIRLLTRRVHAAIQALWFSGLSLVQLDRELKLAKGSGRQR